MSAETLTPAGTSDAMMVCVECDVSGGPFAPAEAAHLHAVHDRMVHGIGSI